MPAGAPKGNQNARKGRLFEQAFLREIKRRDIMIGDGETMRMIAARMLDLILDEKSIAAFIATRETIEGKPQQQIAGTLDVFVRDRDELTEKLLNAERIERPALPAPDGGTEGESPQQLH